MKNLRFRRLTAVVIGLFAAATLSAQTTWKVVSPNARHAIEVEQLSDDDFTFSVITDGMRPIQKSPFSIEGSGIPESFAFTEAQDRSVNRLLPVPVPNYASSVAEVYNEKRLFFSNGWVLNLRAYENGVAFRWESSLNRELTVEDEEIDFRFSDDFTCFYPKPESPAFFSHHENVYEKKRLSQIKAWEVSPVPLLVQLPNRRILMISDVNLKNYPGLWTKSEGAEREAAAGSAAVGYVLEAAFAPYPRTERLEGDRNLRVAETEDFIAKLPPKGETSWKAFLLGEAADLFNPTLFYCLADENALADVSWIHPGLVVWDWWNALNFTDAGFKGGVNQKSYQYNIDFAAENDIPYIILDEGWSLPGPENLLKVVPAIDMPALSAYAKSKGVGLILWMTSTALEMNEAKAFEQFKAWDIKGLKIDFLQRDDQRMMDFCYRTAAKAADYHLLVDYHGASKPAGITRTYPNVVTIESVQGMEQSKWGYRANPQMAVYNAYIRMAVGPMDYTPGAMKNKQKFAFMPNFTSPASQGTRCHQMAMYVLYLSPLQMLSDVACNYRKNPECFDMLKQMPVTWDETRFLGGEIGESVAVARKSGRSWYVGALTNWKRRELPLSLSFLPEGRYRLTEFADGKRADFNASRYEKSERTIEIAPGAEAPTLSVRMAKGGGYFAKLTPLPQP